MCKRWCMEPSSRALPRNLKNTAIFIGGSDVTAAEGLFREAQKHMMPQFGLRVSVLLDANGANTTAAAAVRAAAKIMELKGTPALVLGGTGPVGQRVARLLAREGANVRVGSRQEATCRRHLPGNRWPRCRTPN